MRVFRPLTVLPHLALLLALTAPLSASAVDNDEGVWVVASVSDAIGSRDGDSRWRYWFDTQGRYAALGSGANQWLVRPGIGYQLNDEWAVWAGYARFRTRSASGFVSDEDRWWQDLTWNMGPQLGGRMSARARLEQRSVSTGSDTGLVLRLMARYTRPIGERTTLVVGIEPFFDLKSTDWGGDSGFGQNRALIGLGWDLSDSLNLELAYMNQYFRADSGADRSVHIGVVNLRFRP